MDKAQLRKEYRQKRKSLPEGESERLNRSITELFISGFPTDQNSIIHTYIPIKKNNEPDTYLILNQIQHQCRVFVSKSLANGELIHFPYFPGIKLKENHWGIAEPTDETQALTSQEFFEKYPDRKIIILIPLLIFDKPGNRVGYGKGFYDRFLQYATPDTLKVGLSFFSPVEKITDTHSQDIKLDFCITPERVWAF